MANRKITLNIFSFSWKMMIPGYFNFPFKEVRQVTADKDLMKDTVQSIIENKRLKLQQNGGMIIEAKCTEKSTKQGPTFLVA